jgi:hypothetical protein
MLSLPMTSGCARMRYRCCQAPAHTRTNSQGTDNRVPERLQETSDTDGRGRRRSVAVKVMDAAVQCISRSWAKNERGDEEEDCESRCDCAAATCSEASNHICIEPCTQALSMGRRTLLLACRPDYRGGCQKWKREGKRLLRHAPSIGRHKSAAHNADTGLATQLRDVNAIDGTLQSGKSMQDLACYAAEM